MLRFSHYTFPIDKMTKRRGEVMPRAWSFCRNTAPSRARRGFIYLCVYKNDQAASKNFSIAFCPYVYVSQKTPGQTSAVEPRQNKAQSKPFATTFTFIFSPHPSGTKEQEKPATIFLQTWVRGNRLSQLFPYSNKEVSRLRGRLKGGQTMETREGWFVQ